MEKIEKIAFIGAGRMATAIAAGLIRNGVDKKGLSAFDISKKAANYFENITGVAITSSIKDTLEPANAVVIAVKPQHVKEALSMASPFLGKKLLISIIAGVKIKELIKISGCERVIRVMPNAPALIGEGVSAYSPSKYVVKKDMIAAEKIISSFGGCHLVDEKYMDVITGLSGSGPAYVFDFIQALADGAVSAGLPREQALSFAAKTVMGAAKMVIETGEHPSVLRDQVTSPGGTTAKGLSVLEKNAFRGIVSEAVVSAAERSKELGS